MELKDTIPMMQSEDYKDRLRAEYWQTKNRLDRLHTANVKTDAKRRSSDGIETRKEYSINEQMREQEDVMRRYLYVLELRAEIDGIEL